MVTSPPTHDVPSDWHRALLARLARQLSGKPTVALNPRCLSEQTLFDLFDDLASDDFRLRGSKTQIAQWLQDAGVLSPIPVEEYPAHPSRRTRFYSFEMVRNESSRPSPLELLQAYHSQGVICCFTAIAFHSLSTQPPAHHHIAIPAKTYQRSAPPKSPRGPRAVPRDPLGTRLFSYEGVAFYKTSREERLLPGIQLRYIGPAVVIRITNLEQTLLDTLRHPIACGGPAVVFEAWDEGLPRIDEERIADYLARMSHRATIQRLGYMLDDLEYKPGVRLRSVLDACLAELDPQDPSVFEQLLPGVEYRNLKQPWLVYGP